MITKEETHISSLLYKKKILLDFFIMNFANKYAYFAA